MMKQCAVVFLVLGFAGCVTDPSVAQREVPIPSAKGVYILHEGNFGRGNASLWYFDLTTFQLQDDVFFRVNNKSLGDVGNSIVIRDGRGYIIVNNSHKIEIIDVSNHVNVGTLPLGAGRSPRQMAFVNDTLALVTLLFEDAVLLVDLKNLTVLQAIPVGNNPEGIAVAAGKAFVANSGFGFGETISVVDLGTMAVVNTVTVGDNPASVGVTEQGLVYVLCAGSYGDFSDPDDDTPATIAVVDPVAGRVVTSLTIGGHAFSFAFGPEGMVYVPTTDSVVTVDSRAHRVLGTLAYGNYYGVAADQTTGDVYLADPRNYIQPGVIRVLSATGQLRTELEVGVIPGSMAFKR
jgi:hypothetical protein